MPAYISNKYISTPDPLTVAPARPVAGRTISGLADAANHLLGYKFLHHHSIQCPPVAAPALVASQQDQPVVPPGTSFQAVRHVWRLSPLVQQVFLGFWHIGLDYSPTYGTPSLTARLAQEQLPRTDPVTLKVPSHTRVFDLDRLTIVEAGVRGITEEREGYVYTLWDSETLDVSSRAGQEVWLEVVLSLVRVYAIDIIEVYMEEAGA